jgi:periplasmic divalent cation tolerance protein
MTDKKIVLTTVETREEGQKIARGLVERRLAACVNIIGPIESIYRWKGAVDGAEEYLLIIKTTAEAFSAVHQTIAEMHSYELPECVEIPIEGGSEEYLGWIGENVET